MQVSQLADYFPPRIRERASDYERAIRVLEQTEDHLHVHIRGADDYCVQLERFDDAVGAACTCPYFDNGGPCKHIWAALLHGERIGAFAGDASPTDLVRLAAVPHARTTARKREPAQPRTSAWRQALRQVEEGAVVAPLPIGGELAYVIDLDASAGGASLHLDIGVRTPKRDGELSLPRAATFERATIEALPDPRDREVMAIVAALSGGRYGYGIASRVTLPQGIAAHVIEKAASTGRLSVRLPDRNLATVRFDEGPAYALHLVVTPECEQELVLRGELRRGDEVLPLSTPLLVTSEGLVVFPDRIARLSGSSKWVTVLREHDGALRIPTAEGPDLALELATLSSAPAVDLPDSIRLDEHRSVPAPRLSIAMLRRGMPELQATLSFEYDGRLVPETEPRDRLVHDGVLLVRDRAAEVSFAETLVEQGARPGEVWLIPAERFSGLAAALGSTGWKIEVGGQGVQLPGTVDVSVRSSIDWFDLSAEVRYGQERIALPALLAAARRGDRHVTLRDGSLGLLPEAWLEQHRLVGELGASHGDELRFKKAQLGLLDALLASLPEAQIDEQLARARTSLSRFSKIEPAEPPPGFVGTLRSYQHEGLGWLEFLREFGFGGCLADDMGLGKTIQVLALLEARRHQSDKPSLVVVPKSLLFNWQREAAQFTPGLRVLEHHGQKRSLARLSDYDLVVTTYGTLVRDAAALQAIRFDYAILDEAQAIKNARTDAAKAARLLRCDHRLALTGTPIENRLSDLWSLFEYLNPGMLGASAVWKRYADRSADESADDVEERTTLGRALRPFLLRRTKEQVAHDLPPKTEQIIYCELEGEERAQYDELRTHYRSSLLGLVADKGIERSQMHILEALLRLRQAACHPALIDPARAEQPSAKLTALLGQLEEVVEGGHKAVVFSQFTSLLAVVRQHLDKAGIAYVYLDGKTRDRKARVDQFQNDAATPIFLVSLKAGGVGLNLTAAEYVFLLDPWWNPAVEAQAIDRAHRIGQTKPVIAYRLIGRDTIEEKVLALQAQKRALASAVIDADHALIGGIGKEELELLLS
ncbi:MAG: SNF2-related protein [Polyangia bacterium]